MKNVKRGKSKKVIFLFFLVFILFFSFQVSAELTARTDGEIGIDLRTPEQINYTQKNVNSSDYWDNLDTPSDITGLNSSNINDIFLKNDGDTATGDYTFGSNTLYIDSSNNRIGMGTTTPESKLDIVSESGNPANLIIQSPKDVANIVVDRENDEGYAMMGSFGGVTGFGFENGRNFVIFETTGNDPRADSFSINKRFLEVETGGDMGLAENNLFIKSDGNVGIGTTDPSAPLEVDGNIKTSGALSTGSNTQDGLSNGDINASTTNSDIIKLKTSDLGTCDSSTEGQIKYNGTAHYGCDGSSWNSIY